MGQNFPYVLPLRERQTVVLAWHPDHIGGPARSTNIKPIFHVAPSAVILPFFMRGGALVAHGPLLANSKSEERYHKKGYFSFLDGEYQPPLQLEKNRTSLRKSNSPTVSCQVGFRQVFNC